MENKIIISVLVVLIVVSMIGVVSAEIDTSDPEYIKVLNVINESKWVEVIIGVTSADMREDVIASLLETEIKLINRWSRGNKFSGEITREGLNKLVNNSNVEWVNLDKPLTTGNNESVNNITQNVTQDKDFNNKEKVSYGWLLYILIIVMVFIVIWFILKIKKR